MMGEAAMGRGDGGNAPQSTGDEPFKPESELRASIGSGQKGAGTCQRRDVRTDRGASIGVFKVVGGAVRHHLRERSEQCFELPQRHQTPRRKKIAAALPAIDYRHIRLGPPRRTIDFAATTCRSILGGYREKAIAVDNLRALLKTRRRLTGKRW